MSGFSISPYADLWFVGTDMGTLFRSLNAGESWEAIDHLETQFNSNLNYSSYLGFNPEVNVAFHASGGRNPVRTTDAGKTWDPISIPLDSDERIKDWISDSFDKNFVLAATDKGLYRSFDQGTNWGKVNDVNGPSKGTYIDNLSSGERHVYHATEEKIYLSTDGGFSFSPYYIPSGTRRIRNFTGGRDQLGITLAFIDNNGAEACAWADDFTDASADSRLLTQATCGFVWVKKGSGSFVRTAQEGGDHIRMAENDGQTIYVTGGRKWIRQYGTKVWRSPDAGQSWALKFHQYNWDVTPFEPWPEDLLEYSSVGLEVGWWDGGYQSFSVNRRDSDVLGGTGFFFLHVSKNSADNWLSPFTKFADTGPRVKGKKWSSTGLEMTSVFRFKFHPTNPQIGYAAVADVAGWITEDGGKTFRICKANDNTNYDYAFDPGDDDVVFTVTGSIHDFPFNWRGNAQKGAGGVFKSTDRGLSWTRLTPNNSEYNRQYLSIGYDVDRGIIYAGSQSKGLIRSTNNGATWGYFNNGLPAGDKIISQIKLDPENGNAYILLTGDAPSYSNSSVTGIYFLDVAGGSNSWELLRGEVIRHPDIFSGYKLWYYPTDFEVDFSPGSDRSTLWLVDYEKNGAWLATGVWKSADRGATWNRKIQFTHPTSITLDQDDPSRAYVGGGYQVDGSWGDGGAYYTLDFGETWQKNAEIPLKENLHNVTLDPNQPNRLFYTFFGGGMLYGPRPE